MCDGHFVYRTSAFPGGGSLLVEWGHLLCGLLCPFLIQTSELFLMAAKENCSAGKTIGLCVLGAVISGGNYISALLLMEVTALCLVYCVWKKKKATGKLMCVFIVTLICFLVNCLAPGNAVRQATFEAWSPVRAVLYSYHEAYTQMVAWTSPLVMLGQMFLLPFLWRLSALGEKKRSGIWGYPAFVGIVFPCLPLPSPLRFIPMAAWEQAGSRISGTFSGF